MWRPIKTATAIALTHAPDPTGSAQGEGLVPLLCCRSAWIEYHWGTRKVKRKGNYELAIVNYE